LKIKKIKVKSSFKDKRGVITNVLEEKINSVVLITCKKGAIRANHYHKKDSHWSYIISGSMEYYEENRSGKIDKIIVKKGEMVYSAPKVPHAMKFLEPSVFIALTTKKRKSGKYDKDTVPYKLIEK
jgi:quercetin dioxygenase-like cupin family protein|tara:strand:+ start:2059 stop:2436 length:378 start_codon:yes stop_codon:yes gene_type:complete